jgi:phage shock protein PspC (stress-responsive transcriptional regulator)
MKHTKKLYRHSDEERRVFAGVISGVAEYWAVDVTMLRIVFVLFVLSTGFFPGVFAYILAIFFIPSEGEDVGGPKIYDM